MKLPKQVIERIEGVNSTEEFNEVLNTYETSTAPQELKEEAIRELKARKSCFYVNPNTTDVSVLKGIQEGAADISDIGS